MKRTAYQILLVLALICVFTNASTNAQKAELVVQTEHTSSIRSVAISPDGKTLASGSSDRTVKLWDVASGKELRILNGHRGDVSSVAFSPDGKSLASGSYDRTVKLWDAASGKELRTLSDSDMVLSVAFSPDGKTLASGCRDKTVKLWDVANGKELRSLTGHADQVYSVTFSPDGKTLASGSRDRTVKLWDVASGAWLETLNVHDDAVSSVAFSPDGKTLASGTFKMVKLWNVSGGKELRTFSDIDMVFSVTFSPDGKTLASGGRDKTVKLRDVASGKELRTFSGHIERVVSVSFSPDGKTLASGSWDKTVKLWDINTAHEQKTPKGHTSVVNLVNFSPDGRTLASVNEDTSVRLWDVASGKKFRTLSGHTERIVSVAFSPHGKTLATGSWDKTVKLWDVATGRELRTLNEVLNSVNSVTFSPDGKTLASGTEYDEITLWDVDSGERIETLVGMNSEGYASYVRSVVFSSDGKTLATVDAIKTITLWDVESRDELRTISGHTDHVNSVAFSPGGSTIASGSDDTTVKLWDASTGKELHTLNGHTDLVYRVAFSPDGKTLASGSDDKTVKLWDVASGKLLKSFPLGAVETVDEVFTVVPDFYTKSVIEPISPNGRFQIKTAGIGKFNLHHVKTGKLLLSLLALDKNDWVVIDPDGRFDASPNAQKLMHYVIGLEPIDLEQIKDRYYTPNLLQRVWKGEDLDATRKVSPFTSDELYPTAEYEPLKQGQTTLTVKLTNRGGGIGPVQVFVNGAEFIADARPKGFDPKLKSAEFKIDFRAAKTLKNGESNEIRVVARNEAGWLRSRGSDIIYFDNGQKDDAPQEFYAIIGGVSEYEGDIDLQLAAKDARDFAAAVELGAVKLFGRDKVHIRLLASGAAEDSRVLSGTDSKQLAPTKENFRLVFEEFSKAKPADVFLVYLAGHGTSINKGGDTGDTYLYLTKEAVTTDKSRLLDEKLRNSTTISSEELADWINQVPALKRAMILDTCAAGAVAASLVKPRDLLSPDQIKALDRMKDRTGFFVLMGSAADAQSYEATRYGQGLLTYSLLQAMSGAKLRNGEFADVRTLFSYAEDTVGEMAKGLGGIQQPRIIAPTESRSFDIGQFTRVEKSKFTLAKIKPLILRPDFHNKKLDYDNLELSSILTKALRNGNATTARGSEESKWVYVEAAEMRGAIKPAGGYEVKGDRIKLTLLLVNDNKLMKRLVVEGTLKNMEEFGQKIVQAIVENAE